MRPTWQPRWADQSPADVLLDTLGRFCAACERRLPQAAIAWHTARQEPIEEPLTAGDWPEAIALCENCAFAAARSTIPVDGILLPDRDLTFSLAESSPLSYVHSDGGDGRIVVTPNSAAAEATTAYFALNEHVPALGREFPLEPDADLLTRDWVDPRQELRTRAWGAAAKAATQIEAAPQPLRPTVLGLVQTLAGDTGFWSTWATVLWDALGDPQVLEATLQSPGLRPDSPLPAAAAIPHPFPATRPDWLRAE